MIGIKARDTVKVAVVPGKATRKPLGDINVNLARANVMPSKKNEKPSLSSEFKVFDDGETGVRKKVPVKDPEHPVKGKTIRKIRANIFMNGAQEIGQGKDASRVGTSEAVPAADLQKPAERELAQQFALMLSEKPAEDNSAELAGRVENEVPSHRPVSKLNVKAKEWHATQSGVASRNGTLDGNALPINLPSALNPIAKEFSLFCASQAAATIPSSGSFSPPTRGRKITGRSVTPTRRSSPPFPSAPARLLSELDDRSAEIRRFLQYKESRRRKAIEAMLVEQERQMNRMQPPLMKTTAYGVAAKNPPIVTPTTQPRDMVVGYVQYGNRQYQCKPKIICPSPSASALEIVHSQHESGHNVYKYPTKPSLPIRYQPEEILKLNYLNKRTEKKAEYVAPQEDDIFTNLTHFFCD